MKAVMPVRRSLGVRTVFNLLGPLTNPAGVERQVIGVWGPDVQQLMAEALAELGVRRVLVVHSDDGLDEISVNAPTTVLEVRGAEVVGSWRVDPSEFGIDMTDVGSLKGGDKEENLRRMVAILGGEEHSSAADAVALNAAAALYVAEVERDLQRGFETCREIMHSGAGLDILNSLAKRSMELAEDA